MRDPSTAHCRVYIGNIKDGATPPEITSHFSKYGQVVGVILNRGFGFLQFAKDTSATAAIQQENGSMYQGRKLAVRAALKDKGKLQMQQQQQQQQEQKPEVDLSSKAPLQNPVPQDLNRTARGRPPRSRGGGRGGIVRNPFNEGANQQNGRDRSPLLQGVGGGLQDQGEFFNSFWDIYSL